MKKIIFTVFIAGLLTASCDDSIKRRAATVADFSEMGSTLALTVPAGFSPLSTDNSPAICAIDGCPTVASAVNTKFFAETDSISAQLTATDSRMGGFESRIADHFVPCLGKSAKNMSTSFGETATYTSSVTCLSTYPDPNNAYNTSYGQIVFGKAPVVETEYVIDRVTSSLVSYTSTLWARQELSTNLEIWHAVYNDIENADLGTVVTHLVSYPVDGTLEFSLAGVGSSGGNVPFYCGAQAKLNSSYLYVTGKISPPSATLTTSCDDVAAVTYCLNTTDFTSEAVSNCETAGLTTLSLDAITPTDLNSETLTGDIAVDYSTEVDGFSLEGLEKL